MGKSYYEPAEDSHLLLEQVKKHANGKVLDMGTGSGILAVAAAEHTSTVASVIAADISPVALRVAQENYKTEKSKGIRNLANMRFVKTDLFSNLKGKFDTIIFNPPYLPQDKGIEDTSIYGGKQGYELVERFLSAAAGHLSADGIILLLFSSLTGKSKIDQILSENLFESSQLSTQHIFFEDLYVYLIRKSEILRKLGKIRNLELYAKGTRGLVYVGKYNGKKVAIKIKRPSSGAQGRIQIETHILELLNKKGIGPKIIESDEDHIIMEFVDGTTVLEYFEKSLKKQIISAISGVFEQLYLLDSLKITKEEMHHPTKHVIIRGNKPVMIDFERAKYSEKAHNVTQFCQFITSKNVEEILLKKGISIDKKTMMGLANRYSRDMSRENLKKIINILVS